MGKVLYRKYRSKSLGEIIGQEHITRTLKNALKTNRISHAYLLTGPRGVGKTSVARILAHEINKIPYQEDTTNIDIIEIDAASNRRIDEIRELRDKIHITPALLTYKIYIIDEVHMLTKEAFNALLKTLEEPPEHAIFILATTEAHKLPETIISRTQRYNFRALSPEVICDHLKNIAKTEKIKIDNEAIMLIAEHGDGSFRDSISLLDQVSNIYGNTITKTEVIELLGIAPAEIISEIIALIVSGQPKDVAPLQEKISDLGLSTVQITKQISQYLRDQMIKNNTTVGSYTAPDILRDMLDIQASANPTDAFEIFLYDHTSIKDSSSQAAKDNIPAEPVEPKNILDTNEAPLQTKKEPSKINKEPSKIDAQTSASLAELLDNNLMQQLLTELKKKHNTLYAIARLTTPKVVNDQLILECNFAFHSKQLNDSKNIQIIQKLVKEISGQDISVKSVVAEKSAAKVPKKAKGSDTLNTINNIFGGGELLED